MILVTAATRFALLLAPHVWRKRDRPRARPELAENCCQRATPRKTLGPAPTRCWTAVCYEGVNDGCENLRPSWNNPLRSNGGITASGNLPIRCWLWRRHCCPARSNGAHAASNVRVELRASRAHDELPIHLAR